MQCIVLDAANSAILGRRIIVFFPCKEYLNLWDVHFIIPPMVTFFSSVYVLKADRVRGRSRRIKDWFTLVAMFEVYFFNQRPSI